MTYKARWYTEEGNLRSIGRAHLERLLALYSHDLNQAGLVIAEPESDDAYYQALANVFMRPEGIPASLHEALYFIKGLDNERGEERLVRAIRAGRVQLNLQDEYSTADKALLIWLQDESLVKELHMQVGLDASKSFISFRADAVLPLAMADFTEAKHDIEAALASAFGGHARGRWAEVNCYPRNGEFVFVVRHTEPFRRETRHIPNGTEPMFYWPTVQDLVVFNEEYQELRMNVATGWLKTLYAETFGYYLFGDIGVFKESPKYTLQPLLDEGHGALEGEAFGLQSIRLYELHTLVNAETNDVRIRRADDVFEAYSNEGGLPAGESLECAVFKVRMADSRHERTVTIRPPNRSKYMQDQSGQAVTAWLSEMRFIVQNQGVELADE